MRCTGETEIETQARRDKVASLLVCALRLDQWRWDSPLQLREISSARIREFDFDTSPERGQPIMPSILRRSVLVFKRIKSTDTRLGSWLALLKGACREDYSSVNAVEIP